MYCTLYSSSKPTSKVTYLSLSCFLEKHKPLLNEQWLILRYRFVSESILPVQFLLKYPSLKPLIYKIVGLFLFLKICTLYHKNFENFRSGFCSFHGTSTYLIEITNDLLVADELKAFFLLRSASSTLRFKVLDVTECSSTP